MRAKRWLVAAGAVLLSGALVTGVAVAATAPEGRAAHGQHGPMMSRPDLDQMVKEGKLTQGQADVMAQVQSLHQKAMEQFRADTKAVIDQAVKDGKITQEQADQMIARRSMMKGPRPGQQGPKMGPRTEAELKEKLDEQVKAGRLTQERADQMLKRWQQQKQNKQG